MAKQPHKSLRKVWSYFYVTNSCNSRFYKDLYQNSSVRKYADVLTVHFSSSELQSGSSRYAVESLHKNLWCYCLLSLREHDTGAHPACIVGPRWFSFADQSLNLSWHLKVKVIKWRGSVSGWKLIKSEHVLELSTNFHKLSYEIHFWFLCQRPDRPSFAHHAFDTPLIFIEKLATFMLKLKLNFIESNSHSTCLKVR